MQNYMCLEKKEREPRLLTTAFHLLSHDRQKSLDASCMSLYGTLVTKPLKTTVNGLVGTSYQSCFSEVVCEDVTRGAAEKKIILKAHGKGRKRIWNL